MRRNTVFFKHVVHHTCCFKNILLSILHQDVQKVLQLEYPDITHIQLTKNASVNGVNYREGMVVVHGSVGGL